jgi:drug/metabolite transporter (DMT)-like permease
MNALVKGREYKFGNLAGVLFAIASAATYGAVSTLGKLAYEASSPVYVAAIAYVIGAATLFGYRPKERPQSNLILLILLAGILGAGIAPYLFFRGLFLTTASNAALLSNGEALFTTMLALLFFGERLNRLQLISAIAVLLGLIMVTTDLDIKAISFMQGLEGNVLILSATFVWGIDNNISRMIGQRMNPTVFTRYKNIIGSIFLVSTLLATDPQPFPSSNSLVYILLIGVFAVGLSTAFLMNALSRLGAIRAVMVFSTASIFGLAFAAGILGEQITYVQVLGATVMFIGLYFLNRAKSV